MTDFVFSNKHDRIKVDGMDFKPVRIAFGFENTEVRSLPISDVEYVIAVNVRSNGRHVDKEGWERSIGTDYVYGYAPIYDCDCLEVVMKNDDDSGVPKDSVMPDQGLSVNQRLLAYDDLVDLVFADEDGRHLFGLEPPYDSYDEIRYNMNKLEKTIENEDGSVVLTVHASKEN